MTERIYAVADELKIDCDEDGFHLQVGVWDHDGDFDAIDIRLPQEVAWNLVDEVKPVAEWRREGESAKAFYDAAVRQGYEWRDGEWRAREEE